MARIRSLSRAAGSGRVHPTETDADWSVVTNGEDTLLQISTYGSDSRASEPKVSQTLQFDRSMATTLRNALNETFGLAD